VQLKLLSTAENKKVVWKSEYVIFGTVLLVPLGFLQTTLVVFYLANSKRRQLPVTGYAHVITTIHLITKKQSTASCSAFCWFAYFIEIRPLFVFTARSSYASAVLVIVILSVCLTHACFMTKRKNILPTF